MDDWESKANSAEHRRDKRRHNKLLQVPFDKQLMKMTALVI